jgi:hypothetical protein
MPTGTVIAYLLMIITSTLAGFHCVPVYVHMMIITLSTIYVGCRGSIKDIKDEHGQVNINI